MSTAQEVEEKNDFEFYLRFAKPLVLNLTAPRDRALAAAWIQKLRDEKIGTERLRTDYLKLLLFILQRKQLIGTFSQNPNQFERLEDFPETNLHEVAKELVQVEEEYRRQTILKNHALGIGDYPPYTIEYSANLLEYAVAQDIPNFGVHAFYAFSKEPLPKWERADKGVFAREAAEVLNAMPSITSVTSHSSMSSRRSRGRNRSHSKSRSRSTSARSVSTDGKSLTGTRSEGAKVKVESKKLSPRRVSFEDEFPSPSMGSKAVAEGDRIPPTWGSNLIGVTESPIKHDADLPAIPSGTDKDILKSSALFLKDSQPAFSPFEGSPPSPLSPPKTTKLYSSESFHDDASDIFLESPPPFLDDSPPPLSPIPRASPSPPLSSRMSPSRSPKRYSPSVEDQIDEFNRMLEDYEKETGGVKSAAPVEQPSSPYRSPERARLPPEQRTVEKKPSKRVIRRKRTVTTKSTPRKATGAVSAEIRTPPAEVIGPPPPGTKRKTVIMRKSVTKTPSTGSIKEPVMKFPVSGGVLPPGTTRIPASGVSRGSRIPTPGGSGKPTRIQLSNSSSPYLTPPMKRSLATQSWSPQLPEGETDLLFSETPPSFLEASFHEQDMAEPNVSSPYLTPPLSEEEAIEEYDMEALSQLGLSPADLRGDRRMERDMAFYGSPKQRASPMVYEGFPPGSPKRPMELESPPRVVLSGSPAAQRIIAEANRIHKEAFETTLPMPSEDPAAARRRALEEQYEQYQERYKHRHPDVPRTPPVFSKFREILGEEAERVYQPEEFGEFDDVQWQPGEQFFQDKQYVSPGVSERFSERKPLFKGIQRNIPDEEFFAKEEEPDTLQMLDDEDEGDEDEEADDVGEVLLPQQRSPKVSPENATKILQQIKSDLDDYFADAPVHHGIPVTTPRKSPPPVRPSKSGGLDVILSPTNRGLRFESPPKEFFLSPEAKTPPPRDSFEEAEFQAGVAAEMQQSRKKQRLLVSQLDTQRKRQENVAAAARQYERLLEDSPPQHISTRQTVGYVTTSLHEESIREALESKKVQHPYEPRDVELPSVDKKSKGILEESPPDLSFMIEELEDIPPSVEKSIAAIKETKKSMNSTPKSSRCRSRKVGRRREPVQKERNLKHLRKPPSPTKPYLPELPPSLLYEAGSAFDFLENEAPPEEMPPPPSPESPAESPQGLRMRMILSDEKPPYYSKDQMPLHYGSTRSRSRMVNRKSRPPQLSRIREVGEDYDSDHLPLLEKLESAGRWPKPRFKKMKLPEQRMDIVRESPIQVPAQMESDDITGFGNIIREIESRYSDLPELPEQEPPEDMIGVRAPSRWEAPESELDRPVPQEGGLQSPIRPPVVVPGWKTPPRLQQRKPQFSSPRGVPELQATSPYVQTGSSRMMFPQGTQSVHPSSVSKHLPASTTPFLGSPPTPPSIFDIAPPADLIAEEPPEYYCSPPTVFETAPAMDLSKEAPPEEFYYSPKFKPVTPPYREESPPSPPESPFSLRMRLYQQDEPDYYSQEQMTVLSGDTKSRRRVMSRKSPAPSVKQIHEVPEDYDEEYLPFLEQIADAGRWPLPKHTKMKIPGQAMPTVGEEEIYSSHLLPQTPKGRPRTGRRRVKKTTSRKRINFGAGPAMQPEVSEEVTTEEETLFSDKYEILGHIDEEEPVSERDVTGYGRRIHELEKKYSDLPELPPPPIREDLFGEASPVPWQNVPTELDAGLPAGLPAPMEPPTRVPGWSTPPHLRTPRPQPEPYKFQMKPELRDVLFYESQPPEMYHSPTSSPVVETHEIVEETYFPEYDQVPSGTSPRHQSPEISPRTPPAQIRHRNIPEEYGSSCMPTPRAQASGSPFFSQRLAREDPPFLVLEMPPDEFVPAGSPPSPTYWNRRQEELERMKEMLKTPPEQPQQLASRLPTPGSSRIPTVGARASRIPSTRTESSTVTRTTTGSRIATPRGSQLPTPRARTQRIPTPAPTRLTAVSTPKEMTTAKPQRKKLPMMESRMAEEEAADVDILKTIESHTTELTVEPLSEEEFRLPPPPRKHWRERIEEAIADVPIPYGPHRPPLEPPRCVQWESPERSYQLPEVGPFDDQIDAEPMPSAVWDYRSPRTPSPQKPSSYHQTVGQMQPRNLFGEQTYEGMHLLEDELPPEDQLPLSPTSPRTPPPLETFYKVHTPSSSPDSPTHLRESLRQHEYTKHFYDDQRKFLSRSHTKNKAVPSRAQPIYEVPETEYSPIRRPPVVEESQLLDLSPPDSDLLAATQAYDIRQKAARQYDQLLEETFSETVTTTEEVIPAEEMDACYPLLDKPVPRANLPPGMADPGLGFRSPPRPQRTPIPPRYVPHVPEQDYGTQLVHEIEPPDLYYTPPEYRERDVFDEAGDEVDIMDTTPPEAYYSPPPLGQDYLYEEGESSPPQEYYSPLPMSPPRTQAASTPPSPIESPSFVRSVHEHRYTQQFFEKDRSTATPFVKSGNKMVRLQRKSPGPKLSTIEEPQLEPVDMYQNVPRQYELPRTDIYGSSGKEYGRTPHGGREQCQVIETTIIEESEEEDYGEVNVSDRIPFGGSTSPGILDTSLIDEDLDQSFVEDGADWSWLG